MTKASHLMISGLGDCDPYRMSARDRGEHYKHVGELADADFALKNGDFQIVYIDPSKVYRGTPLQAVDVRADRLAWATQFAEANPEQLLVVVSSGREDWGQLLEGWGGFELPNVFRHEQLDGAGPNEAFLAPIVDAWTQLGR